MSRTTVTFDGHDLTADYIVSDLRRPLLPTDVGTVDVAGRDGSIFTVARRTSRDITLTLTCRHDDVELREASARELAAILAVDEPKRLAVSIDGGIGWMCVPTSTNDAQRYLSHTSFDVTFRCVEAAGRGDAVTVSVPSGGSATFEVGGTYPTMPTISAASAVRGSDGYWQLLLDGVDHMRVELDTAASHEVVADCERCTLAVNGTNAMLELTSDWFVLEPGEHTVQMTGTGATTITFEERWL